MNRKIVVCLLTTALLSTVPFVEAQQAKKVWRIGYLSPGSPSSDSVRIDAFRQGLRELGYVEGKNITIEYRYAENNPDRYPDLAAELVRLRVDVIVTGGDGPIRAAKKASSTIPIVMAYIPDPVAFGFVASLARPGGNITGMTNISPQLSGKRLELLKEVIPRALRISILYVRGEDDEVKESQRVADTMGVKIQRLEVVEPSQFESAYAAMVREHADGVIVSRNQLTNSHRKRLSELATKNRLPAMCEGRDFATAGCLISYAREPTEGFRVAATYVDKILKGTKPADLPVEQPMKFELVINLKTAKQIGLTIPPNVLARADRVIK